MPFALIIAGIVLTVAGVRNTQATLFNMLQGDFTGNNSFIWWSVSIIGIGAIGYVPSLRKLANYFLALVLIVLVLANRGIFQSFINALKAPVPQAPVQNAANSNSAANTIGSLANDANTLAAIGNAFSSSGGVAALAAVA